MKRIYLKIGLTILIILSPLSVSAYDFEANGLYFTVTSFTELTVSVDGAANTDIERLDIPQTVEYKGKSLTVTKINDSAFWGCKKMVSVSLPPTIQSIGVCAFKYCSLLKDIVLPDSLLSLEAAAFYGCSALETIRIPDGITGIKNGLFQKCDNLVSVTLNDNVRTIGAYAFSCNKRIKEIKLPLSLTKIGFEAFSYCDSLKNIQLPENLEEIDDYAFLHCDMLEEFVFPSKVWNIKPTILWRCSNISKLTIGKGLWGLPVYFEAEYLTGLPPGNGILFYQEYYQSFESYSSLRRYTGIDPSIIFNEHLSGLKTIIIEDTANVFHMRGNYKVEDIASKECVPAFANLNLDYFYVGRPLVGIKEWTYGKEKFTVYRPEITGHINKLEIAGFCTENPYFYQKVDTLILGTNIRRFNPDNLETENLKEIVCQSTIPPSVDDDKAFPNNVYLDVTLYIPKGCRDAYSNAFGWRNFWNIKELEDYHTGIRNLMDCQNDISITVNNGLIIVNNAPHHSVVRIFNLQGALVAKSQEQVVRGLAKGTYIVAVGGKTFKVVL